MLIPGKLLVIITPMAQAAGAWEGEDDHVSASYDQRLVVPDSTTRFETKELSWFASFQIPSDLSIQVEHCIFKVHKYPLVSKCGYISRFELNEPSLKLENFPGGLETFEVILRFCYNLPIDLNPGNIAALRCASEYLDMSEEFEDGNLISKTEAFLTFVVLASWKDTVAVLRSCENLSPWAENLQVVRRCCDSIAYKASRDHHDQSTSSSWWIDDDLATLRIDHFMRIMSGIRAKGAKAETMGKCIMNYAQKWLPGLMHDGHELHGLRAFGFGKKELEFSILSDEDEQRHNNKEQRAIIESLVSIITNVPGAVSCKFLLQLLKAAMLYSASPALISELEKRVGMMLEDAHADDLLIPIYKNEDLDQTLLKTGEKPTIHNVDMMQRIVEYFLMHEQQQQKTGKTNVSKLVDNYLAEIARDPNLSVTKFQALAEALPPNSRSCDDGLYRAIDTYLKTHPSLSEHDRRRLCKIMNSEKLSLDACMHAAQNDRLPLRSVIQVLFSEQMKMRRAMEEGKESGTRGENLELLQEETHNSSTTNAELKNLKSELEDVKAKMTQLQNDYGELQKEYEKTISSKRSPWSLGWRKIKKSIHTKAEGDDENGGGTQLRSNNPAGRRSSLLRRLSLS